MKIFLTVLNKFSFEFFCITTKKKSSATQLFLFKKIFYFHNLISLCLFSCVLSFGQAYGQTPPLVPSFAPLVKQVAPAVVNIAVTHSVPKISAEHIPSTIKNTPLEQRYRERMQDHGNEFIEAGSGFIIDPTGYIVTNAHVIYDAENIVVSFTNGGEFSAKIIGTDPLTDIAVIKISDTHPLPFVTWGDSRLVQIGDWIMAAGNPFGLGSSITVGVVSARGRDIGASPFEDFLQLNANINPGNSGGPTFDMQGHVIAVNTAIISPSAAATGLSFSIPSEIVIPIIDTLRKDGHIDRGWIGATLYDEPIKQHGAKVTEVDKNSPALIGGIRKNDVIIALNKDHVDNANNLIRAIAAIKPQTKVKFTVLRNRKQRTFTVTVGLRPALETDDDEKR